jgi:acetyltransferase-like isoleucine patch superfamily enzyme
VVKIILKAVICFLPWRLKRWLMIKIFGYKIHPNSRIGYSWVFPGMLILDDGAFIDSLCVFIHLDSCLLQEKAYVGRMNWITGHSSSGTKFYLRYKNRTPRLILNAHSTITRGHHIDCSDLVSIGRFSTIAGYNSQILTHSINIDRGEQSVGSVEIGDYCFVGTRSIILPGSSLPSYCVLAAGAVLCSKYTQEYMVYAGVPARPVKGLRRDAKYFTRLTGEVV